MFESEQLHLHKIIDAQTIEKRVKELALSITDDYSGREPLLAAVLKGSFIFLADIARHIDLAVKIDFITVSSYGSGTTAGEISLLSDIGAAVRDKDVIIVEDIADTGNSLKYLKDHLEKMGPSSLRTCILIDKTERRGNIVDIDYTGFRVSEGFVVGYGMDYKEKGRNLKDIYVLTNLEE